MDPRNRIRQTRAFARFRRSEKDWKAWGKTVAKRFRAVRDDARSNNGPHTIEEFAEALDVAKSTIDGHLKGDLPKVLRELYAIRSHYGDSIDWLLAVEGAERKPDVTVTADGRKITDHQFGEVLTLHAKRAVARHVAGQDETSPLRRFISDEAQLSALLTPKNLVAFFTHAVIQELERAATAAVPAQVAEELGQREGPGAGGIAEVAITIASVDQRFARGEITSDARQRERKSAYFRLEYRKKPSEEHDPPQDLALSRSASEPPPHPPTYRSRRAEARRTSNRRRISVPE